MVEVEGVDDAFLVIVGVQVEPAVDGSRVGDGANASSVHSHVKAVGDVLGKAHHQSVLLFHATRDVQDKHEVQRAGTTCSLRPGEILMNAVCKKFGNNLNRLSRKKLATGTIAVVAREFMDFKCKLSCSTLHYSSKWQAAAAATAAAVVVVEQ